MSTTEQKQQTPTPAEIPFTTPQAMSRFVTDTGKILYQERMTMEFRPTLREIVA